MTYFTSITGLRSIALSSVLLFHFFPEYFPYGYLGVDLFFVISGFVITLSLEKRASKANYFLRFYTDRVIRLAPALVCTVLFSAIIFSAVWHAPGEALKTGIFAMFGLANIQLSMAEKDYFSQDLEFNPFTHTWSLGVEEQFYLIFPLLFLITRRMHQWNLYLVSFLMAISILLNFIGSSDIVEFYSPVHRAWQILAGCWLAIFMLKQKLIQTNFQTFFAHVVSLMLLLGSISVNYNFPQDFFLRQLLVVLGGAFFILYCDSPSFLNVILNSRSLQLIGHASYSIYLVHWPLKVFTAYLPDYRPVPVLTLILSLLVGVFIYKFVERPIFSYSKGSNFRIKPVGMISLLFCFTLMTLIILALGLHRKIKIYSYDFLSLPTVQYSLKSKYGNDTKFINEDSDVLVLGDSHATNLVKSINLNLPAPVTYNGSIPFLTKLYKSKLSTSDEIRALIDLPINMMSDKLVVFSISRSRLYNNNYYFSSALERKNQIDKEKLKILELFLSNLIEAALAADSKILIVDDVPYTCSSVNLRRELFAREKTCFINKNLSDIDRKPLSDIYQSLLRRFPEIYYLDPNNYLCIAERCRVFLRGQPVYADQSPHFSLENGSILSRAFKESLQEIYD